MKAQDDARESLRVCLAGPAIRDGRIALADLAHFGKHLQSGLFRVATLLLGAGTSSRAGRTPKQITDACTLEVLALERGSVALSIAVRRSEHPTILEAPSFGEQALEQLIRGLQALEDPAAPLPSGYDAGVLCSWREAAGIFRKGVDSITFDLRTSTTRCAVHFSPALSERIAARLEQPVRNRRTVEGRLLMGDFKETGYQCRIHPPVGSPVNCTFDEPYRDAVLGALTKQVRLIGDATETDGRIRTLKIADIEVLEDLVPTAFDETALDFEQSTDIQELAAHQGVTRPADFDGLLGDFWPEDETVDEFVATVRTWRRESSGSAGTP